MFALKNNLYWITTLYFLIWGSSLYAQDTQLHNERTLLIAPELKGSNPAFLQVFKDSIIFNANIFSNFKKGNFVNYYQPNQSLRTGAISDSYIRLNERITVYGLASYYFSKGKNSGGSSFFYPYRIPFNFTPIDETTKGDNKIEQYHLIGGLSYKLLTNLSLGAKIDYQTISFAKLKDMRNINDILELNLFTGIQYDFSKTNSIGFSYHYNRYIENMKINQYGQSEKDYYALLNKGSFMGLLYIYGDDGILDTRFKRPWIEIVHTSGVQYTHKFSKSTNWFVECQYGFGKGHYGNDSDNSVVYVRHNRNAFTVNSQLNIKKTDKTHIFSVKSNYDVVINYDQLYREVTTKEGNSITEYYGRRQTLNRRKLFAEFSYHLLWGKAYFDAPWHFTFNYKYNNLSRKTSYFPFYRKQNINWHQIDARILKSIKYNKIDWLIQYSAGFVFGNGGFPIDKTYNASATNTKPDYLNNLLHQEREYLTSKRLHSQITTRIGHLFNHNEIYTQLTIGYIHPFEINYLKGNSFSCDLSVGIAF